MIKICLTILTKERLDYVAILICKVDLSGEKNCPKEWGLLNNDKRNDDILSKWAKHRTTEELDKFISIMSYVKYFLSNIGTSREKWKYRRV